LGFRQQALLQHLVNPGVDAAVEGLPVFIAQAQHDVLIGRLGAVGALRLGGEGLAAQLDVLQGPDNPLHVVGVDFLRRLGVQLLQALVEGVYPLVLRLLEKPLAQGVVPAALLKGEAPQQRAGIQTRAAH